MELLTMTQEIVQAFLLIFVAEMGDKTQILAMAFATRFPVKKVLVGIAIGSFLNHGLAVLLGSYLSNFIPIDRLQIIAGIAFVGFALWTLKTEEDEDEEEATIQMGPIGTVALAFFLGELGDKTQLTAITLATDAYYPLLILVGTVSGMVATGALGIFVGKKMGDKIPEFGIKVFAAIIFMFFGLQKLATSVPTAYLRPIYVVPTVLLLTLSVLYLMSKLVRQRQENIQTAFKLQAKMLHDYYAHIHKDLTKICVGGTYCTQCKGNQCAIGHAKEVIDKARTGTEALEALGKIKADYEQKPFSKEKVYDSLIDTLWIIEHVDNENQLAYAHIIRQQMESILFGSSITPYVNIHDYIQQLLAIDSDTAEKLRKMYELRKPIEERVINLGNRISNLYLIELMEGYLLIDTGYAEQYEDFYKKLEKQHIKLEDIRYVFLTHAHDDHVGFLNQILEKTHAKVILHPEAITRLKTGQNSFEGGCSSRLAWGFCQLMKVFGKGKHQYQPVNAATRYWIADANNKPAIENTLGAKVVELPGHTKDSIGLLFEQQVLFSGDATMNGLPSRHHVIIWIENLKEYRHSWMKMATLNYKKVYPSHGNPFVKKQLVKNEEKLAKIKIHPL